MRNLHLRDFHVNWVGDVRGLYSTNIPMMIVVTRDGLWVECTCGGDFLLPETVCMDCDHSFGFTLEDDEWAWKEIDAAAQVLSDTLELEPLAATLLASELREELSRAREEVAAKTNEIDREDPGV